MVFFAALFLDLSTGIAGEAITAGQAFPHFAFTDIDGKKAHTRDFPERIMVLSVADRESSDRLRAWLRVAGLEALRATPHLQFAYISIADVSAVPGLFQGIARQAISYIDRSSNEELLAFYKENQFVPRKQAIISRLIPDWDGQVMARLGVENAEKFHCWIVFQGRVIAALPEGTDRIEARYLKSISNLDGGPVKAAPRAKEKDAQLHPGEQGLP